MRVDQIFERYIFYTINLLTAVHEFNWYTYILEYLFETIALSKYFS